MQSGRKPASNQPQDRFLWLEKELLDLGGRLGSINESVSVPVVTAKYPVCLINVALLIGKANLA